MRRSDVVILTPLLLLAFVLSFGAAMMSLIDSIADEEVAVAYDRWFKAGVDSVPVIIEDDPARSSSIPLYLQTDPQWSSDSYSTGTIESHGCGLVSAAIAVSYLSGERVTPRLAFNVCWRCFPV